MSMPSFRVYSNEVQELLIIEFRLLM